MSETMTHADKFWLCMDDPVNLMVITAFMEFEEPLDYNRFFATIDARLASFTRFKTKVVKPFTGIGAGKWVKDKNFNLRSHIHRLALPAPGDKNELQDLISSLRTKSLDFNKPLWDIHLIENYGKGCVLFFRIHHCIGDGSALMHVLLSTADSDPDAPWPVKGKQSDSTKKIPEFAPFFSVNPIINSTKTVFSNTWGLSKLLLKWLKKYSSDPNQLKQMGKFYASIPPEIAKVLTKHSVMNSDPKTAFKGKLGVQKRVVWTDPIPLDKIKKVGKAIDSTTLNDVLIATVTGAMRTYLKTRKTPVNELDLRVTVPVNIRKPGTEFELGNKFSLVFLPLPVYLEDPILRLKEVHRRMNNLKYSAEPYVNFGLLSAIGLLPTKFAQKGAQLFGNKVSGVLTNVPGPKIPLYFGGKKISNIMFWVPQSGIIGLGISILSYDGKVTMGITSDEGLMPDPETLLEGFQDEFDHLLKLVQSGQIYNKPLVLHDRFKETDLENKIKKTGKDTLAAQESSDEHNIDKDLTRCKAYTKSGQQCNTPTLEDSDYCQEHHQYQEKESLLDDVEQIMRELAE